jgi:hypothetical protein
VSDAATVATEETVATEDPVTPVPPVIVVLARILVTLALEEERVFAPANDNA